MCYKVTCSTCGLYTWAGCGRHKDRVIAQIPINERCKCDRLSKPKPKPEAQKPSKSLLNFMNDNKYQPQKTEMYNLLRAAVQETTKQMIIQNNASNNEEKKSESNNIVTDYDSKESDFFSQNSQIETIKNVMINSNKQHPLYDLQSWKQEKWSITLAELILRSKFIQCAETLIEAMSKLNDFENHCYTQMKKRNKYETDYGLLYFLGFRLARSRLNILYLEQMENKSHLTIIIPMYNAYKNNNNSKDFVRRKVSEIQWLYKNISHIIMDWNIIFIDDICPNKSGNKTLEMIASEAFCDRNCPCAKEKITVQFLEKGVTEINKFKNDNNLQKICQKYPTQGAAVQYGMYKALAQKIEGSKKHFICYAESDLCVNIAQCGNLLAEIITNDIKKERIAAVADKIAIIGTKNASVNNVNAVVIKLKNIIISGLFPVFKTFYNTDNGLRIFTRECISKILPTLRLYSGWWESELLLNIYNELKEEKENKEYICKSEVVWSESVADIEQKMDILTNEFGWKHYGFIQQIVKVYKNKGLDQKWVEFVGNLQWKDYFKICQVVFCNKYNMNTWNPSVDDLKYIIEKEVYPEKAPVFIEK